MAISSYKTYLMWYNTESTETNKWVKLCDVKSIPDLGGAPESLQTTTLSDKMHTYIPGIQDTEALSFTANYTKADFEKLDAMVGSTEQFAVWFGATTAANVDTPDGSEGKFTFSGQLSVYVNSADVNSVVEMTITIMPSTVIVES